MRIDLIDLGVFGRRLSLLSAWKQKMNEEWREIETCCEIVITDIHAHT